MSWRYVLRDRFELSAPELVAAMSQAEDSMQDADHALWGYLPTEKSAKNFAHQVWAGEIVVQEA